MCRAQHPDKNKEANATATFQALGVVHATLSDPEKRKVYDRTGVLEDDDGLSGDGREWCVIECARRLTVS